MACRTQDLLDSIKQEYKEHEDLPNTTNPDDWAKISGKKGERIVFIRTLVKDREQKPPPRAAGPSNGSAPASTCDRGRDGRRYSFRVSCASVGCPHGDPQGLRHRDRVRHHGARSGQRRVSNPVAASSLLINAYLAATHRKVGWDFEDEHPGNDARGFSVDDLLAPEVETHLVNAVLTNGARYYVDHAHPEISTPECLHRAGGRALRPGRRGDRPRAAWPPRPAHCCPTAPRSCATRTTPTARATATAATRTTCWPATSRSAGSCTRSRRTSSPARS